MQDYSLLAKLEQHPRREAFEKLASEKDRVEKRLEIYEGDLRKLRSKNTSARTETYIANIKQAIVKTERQLSALKGKLSTLKAKMTKDVFNEADVVCMLLSLDLLSSLTFAIDMFD